MKHIATPAPCGHPFRKMCRSTRRFSRSPVEADGSQGLLEPAGGINSKPLRHGSLRRIRDSWLVSPSHSSMAKFPVVGTRQKRYASWQKSPPTDSGCQTKLVRPRWTLFSPSGLRPDRRLHYRLPTGSDFSRPISVRVNEVPLGYFR